MNTLRLAAVAAALGMAVSLPAAQTGLAAAAAPARSCFYITQINNTRAVDARTLYVRVSGKSVYRFDMKHDCQGLRPTSQTIVLEPKPSGQICSPIDVNITVGERGAAERCIVVTIVKLGHEEAAALPKSVSP